jgi:hypothetical protein
MSVDFMPHTAAYRPAGTCNSYPLRGCAILLCKWRRYNKWKMGCNYYFYIESEMPRMEDCHHNVEDRFMIQSVSRRL